MSILFLHGAGEGNACVFLYHSKDDETVPFDHLAPYARLLPQATVRGIDEGGHQFNNDLAPVAKDFRNLQKVALIG